MIRTTDPTAWSAPAGADHAEKVYSIAAGNVHPLEPEVCRSWQRSLNEYRIAISDPLPPRILTQGEIDALREPLKHVILSGGGDIDQLYNVVKRTGYVVLFCNVDGVVVEHRGDEARCDSFKHWGTWLGGVWSEEVEGTNGIGTCIAEQRPMTIHRDEHFRSRHIQLSCSAAPIFDAEGRLVAVLDVSSIDPQLSDISHGLAGPLTMSTARAIEERCFRERFRREWVVALPRPEEDEGDSALLLAVDRDQRIVGANRSARSVLELDDGTLQKGFLLWSFFERDEAPFMRNGRDDMLVELNAVDRPTRFFAMITPPEVLSRGQAEDNLHTRPRVVPRINSGKQSPFCSHRGRSPREALSYVLQYVDCHIDEPIGLETLASTAGMSTHHFARVFKRWIGLTPHCYLLQRRLARAQELLSRENLSLSEIALAAGFADQSHLTRHFRSQIGETPSAFRRSRFNVRRRSATR
jgi:AraC-like DNA-binding protein/PAS domain-containing protein